MRPLCLGFKVQGFEVCMSLLHEAFISRIYMIFAGVGAVSEVLFAAVGGFVGSGKYGLQRGL